MYYVYETPLYVSNLSNAAGVSFVPDSAMKWTMKIAITKYYVWGLEEKS